ncbi:MAG: Gx transporter family protein [Eubacterium sp.]
MHMPDSKKISITALFTAFAVILSYIETLIPAIGIPGVKLGLANFAIVLALYFLGYKAGITINIIRIIIIGAFFGNLFSIYFSIAGAVISYAVMALLKKTEKVSMITVAIVGGVFHNIGQIIIAFFVVDTYGVFTYIPVLIISGIITGSIIGILADIIYKRTKHILSKII